MKAWALFNRIVAYATVFALANGCLAYVGALLYNNVIVKLSAEPDTGTPRLVRMTHVDAFCIACYLALYSINWVYNARRMLSIEG